MIPSHGPLSKRSGERELVSRIVNDTPERKAERARLKRNETAKINRWAKRYGVSKDEARSMITYHDEDQMQD